mmetsp:Transcript_19822/g.53073  ORF Transcript_19822/g.53073 Transcript_19822/m.53073 type:complete len:273 (-) Transcript_19822:44-862(-)
MQVQGPEECHQKATDRNEEHTLHAQPGLQDGAARLAQDTRVEGHERQGVEVHVVLQLLWCGVVLVVLVAPPRTRHATAHTVENDLQHPVSGDVARHRVVTSLVHQPPASSRGDADDEEAQQPDPRLRTEHEHVRSDELHDNNLSDTIKTLGHGWVEEALRDKLVSQFLVVLGYAWLPVASASGQHLGRRLAIRKAGKDLLRHLAASVKLPIGLSSVTTTGEEAYDVPARMVEARDIIETPLDQDLCGILLRSTCVSCMCHGCAIGWLMQLHS